MAILVRWPAVIWRYWRSEDTRRNAFDEHANVGIWLQEAKYLTDSLDSDFANDIEELE